LPFEYHQVFKVVLIKLGMAEDFIEAENKKLLVRLEYFLVDKQTPLYRLVPQKALLRRQAI